MNIAKDEDDTVEHFPIANSADNAILMHRDAHFGGSFNVMLDYYRNGGKGIHPDFDLERIENLAKTEEEIGQNLAPLLLSGPEAESIGEAKQAYKSLRDIYAQKNKSKNSLLIADLILSENDPPKSEIEAIVSQKEAIVPHLIELLRSETFHNPLFPGYGLAPALAAQCLGLIGSKKAIISLFESIGESDFFDDDISLEALKLIGEPAKNFLLKVLKARPLTEDNEKAAIAILKFKEDVEVSTTCLKMLKEQDVRKDPILSTYLILACSELNQPEQRNEFADLLQDPGTPKTLHPDIKVIISHWPMN